MWCQFRDMGSLNLKWGRSPDGPNNWFGTIQDSIYYSTRLHLMQFTEAGKTGLTYGSQPFWHSSAPRVRGCSSRHFQILWESRDESKNIVTELTVVGCSFPNRSRIWWRTKDIFCCESWGTVYALRNRQRATTYYWESNLILWNTIKYGKCFFTGKITNRNWLDEWQKIMSAWPTFQT